MRVWTLEPHQMQELANNAAFSMMQVLHKDGLLKGDLDKLAGEYVVVLAEPSWFGRMFAKLAGKKDADIVLYVVKVMH